MKKILQLSLCVLLAGARLAAAPEVHEQNVPDVKKGDVSVADRVAAIEGKGKIAGVPAKDIAIVIEAKRGIAEKAETAESQVAKTSNVSELNADEEIVRVAGAEVEKESWEDRIMNWFRDKDRLWN